MAIGRVTGPMLNSNLDRQGIDIAIDTNLLYAAVAQRYVGINTANPLYTLDVNGEARVGNLYLLGNTISSDTGKINFGSNANIVINGGSNYNFPITDGNGNISWVDLYALPEAQALIANTTAANALIFSTNNALTGYINVLNYAMKANVDGANLAIVAANAAVVSYVNTLNTAQTANIQAANAAITTIQTNTLGNNIPLGSNSISSLSSNAAVFTANSNITDSIAQLNYVLGKLVPPSPPPFPNNTSISIASSTTSGLMCNFTQTDNTATQAHSVTGGTSVSATRSVAYTTSAVTNVGPGSVGNVSAYLNGTLQGNITLTGTNSNTTNGNIYVYNVQDYHNVLSTVTAGFWTVFSTYATGNVAPGWNEVYIYDTSTNTKTNTLAWYYDSSAPGTPSFSNTSMVLSANSVTYSSTVPHANTNSQFKLKGNISHLSGDLYYTGTFITSAGGGAFATPQTLTYTQLGITTPLTRNLYVSSGSAYFETTANITSGFGQASSGSGPILYGNSPYATGSNAFSPGVIILYKTGTSTNIEETSIPVSVSLGAGYVSNGYRVVNPGSTDNPSYTTGTPTFNSQTSTLTTSDATVVGGVLRNDQNNYATGYFPVGPNLSGQANNQYFTIAFQRTVVSKFDISLTSGNTGIAGLWVALPGLTETSTYSSATNGWLDMTTAYAGSGTPGTGSGANGSTGAAVGGTVPVNTLITSKSYTTTFGGLSSTGSASNVIYVRIKLTPGQTVTALSITTPSH